jgi:hypothetical protein
MDTNIHVLAIDLDCGSLHFNVVARSQRSAADRRVMYGLQLLDGQERERARLAVALFNNECPFEVTALAGPAASRRPADTTQRSPLTPVP